MVGTSLLGLGGRHGLLSTLGLDVPLCPQTLLFMGRRGERALALTHRGQFPHSQAPCIPLPVGMEVAGAGGSVWSSSVAGGEAIQ